MTPAAASSIAATTGFSDVDGSARADDLVDYLGSLARMLADVRRADYVQLQLTPGAAVLDVGCGAGEVCVELAGMVGPSGRVAGIDPSKAMITAAGAAARAAGVAVDLQVASVHELPYPDASFDAVRAERVFQHLDDPDGALLEMIRVVRPGGRVMVIDPDHGQLTMALDTAAERRALAAVLDALQRAITNPRSGSRLLPQLRDAGLHDVSQTTRVVSFDHAATTRAVMLADRLRDAVAVGALARDEADAFERALAARAAAGRFCAYAIGYSVVGRRPH